MNGEKESELKSLEAVKYFICTARFIKMDDTAAVTNNLELLSTLKYWGGRSEFKLQKLFIKFIFLFQDLFILIIM